MKIEQQIIEQWRNVWPNTESLEDWTETNAIEDYNDSARCYCKITYLRVNKIIKKIIIDNPDQAKSSSSRYIRKYYSLLEKQLNEV